MEANAASTSSSPVQLEQTNILMELCDGGSLQQRIQQGCFRKEDGTLDEVVRGGCVLV